MKKKQSTINGLVVRFEPKNSAQVLAKKLFHKSKILFLLGESGCGKTHCALGLGLEAAVTKKPFEPLVVCRPVIEATGENLGFLPGNVEEKIDPYLKPLFDCLAGLVFMQGPAQTKELFSPIAFAHMRGVTFSGITILDEAQNCTREQLLLFLTRLGTDGRMLITGDPSQSDIPNSGLLDVVEKLKVLPEIEVVEFPSNQNMRNPLVSDIVRLLTDWR